MRFVKEVSGTLLSRIVSSLLGFGTSVLVARALQPQGKGILATMTATAELAAALGTVGAGKSLTFLIAQARFPRQEIASTATAMALLNGLFVGAVVMALGSVLRSHVLPELPWLAVLAAVPLAFARVLSAYGEGIVRGLREILACNRALAAQSAVVLALTVGLLSVLTPPIALSTLAAGSCIAVALYARSVGQHNALLTPRLSLPVARALLAYGVGYQAVGLLQMVHYRIDLFLVGHFGGAESAGWYSTAANLAQVPWNIPLAVSFVIMPWVASRDGQAAGEGTAASARWTLWMTLILSLILGVLADALVGAMYGTAFLPSAAPLRILLPGVVMNSLLLVLGGYLLGRGSTGVLILVAGGSAALNVVLNLLFLPALGIRGAAAASTLTYSLAALLVVWWVSRTSGTPLADFLLPRRRDVALLREALTGRR